MSRSLRLALAVCLAVLIAASATYRPAAATSPNVVISQVYGGGGNSGATYKNDFIELFNASGATVSLSGWSVQYASSSGTTWQTTPLSGSIGPGEYYLVQEAAGAAGTTVLPAPDATGTIAMSATAGKIALAPATGALSGACPTGVVDFVGYGAANCFEGAGPVAALTNTTAAIRANSGCTDTDSNGSDFATGAPAPRNSAASPVVCAVSGNLGLTASANPASVSVGGSTSLTVVVTPAENPASTGIAVTGDLSSIGGDGNQTFSASGNTFTFSATVSALTPPGAKSLPVIVTDAQGRMASSSIALTVTAVVPSNAPVVISQVYGGGGNSGAIYRNDFVELYNRSSSTVDVGGWSVQYGSASGTAWLVQALAGTIGPGEYLLVKAGSNGSTGADLPPENVDGSSAFNLSATSGKVALVNVAQALSGCPAGDARIVDLVGYGSANCREGANAPAPSNTTALFRGNGGATDTDRNDADFSVGAPAPRRTAPFVEVGPSVASVDPAPGSKIAPRDATMTVTFTEPVDVPGAWFSISCPSGLHDDATTALTSQGAVHTITPNATFTPGETCTATIFRDAVSDQDLDDPSPDLDHLKADYVWSFTIATGTEPPYPADVHLAMGNPSGAVADVNVPGNYLMMKPEYALSYNAGLGRPNWVSWHLSDEWTGNLARNDTFRPDPAVPADWYRVQAFDFSGSGFDRGHMTPNADRDKDTSVPINQATFLMSNMVAQSPDNNQGPWANLENYLRSLTPADELYIVSGPFGAGGAGSNGYAETIANGHVTVPAWTWKAALVLPKLSGDDLSRVDCSTRTIAVMMPNVQGIRTADPADWQAYLTTIDAIESQTGYDLFSSLPSRIQGCMESRKDGDPYNPLITPAQATMTIEAGTSSVDVSGTIGAGPLIPAGSVTVTVGSSTAEAVIEADGHFTATIDTGALAASTTAYTIAFSYAGGGNFNAANATSSLMVTDTTAPAIAGLMPGVTDLGAPSHKMMDVGIDYTATDFSGATCGVSVTANEPVNGLGDGNTSLDWQVIDAHHVQLRAERSGTGSGRIYTITVTCVDAAGNRSSAATTVGVPH